MKQYVMDIETDGLLDDVTTVHLMICKDADTGQLYIARGHSDVKYLLE